MLSAAGNDEKPEKRRGSANDRAKRRYSNKNRNVIVFQMRYVNKSDRLCLNQAIFAVGGNQIKTLSFSEPFTAVKLDTAPCPRQRGGVVYELWEDSFCFSAHPKLKWLFWFSYDVKIRGGGASQMKGIGCACNYRLIQSEKSMLEWWKITVIPPWALLFSLPF